MIKHLRNIKNIIQRFAINIFKKRDSKGRAMWPSWPLPVDSPIVINNLFDHDENNLYNRLIIFLTLSFPTPLFNIIVFNS